MSIRKSDIKILRKNADVTGSSASSLDNKSVKSKPIDYPVEQNPFEAENNSIVSPASSKSSFAPIRSKFSKSEYDYFSQNNKKDFELYDNLNPELNFNHSQPYYDNLKK